MAETETETKSKSGCGSLIVLLIIIVFIWKSCFDETGKKQLSNDNSEKNIATNFIPENSYGWYRCVIPGYDMNVGNVHIDKSLFYISLHNGYSTVLHSQLGVSFIGSGEMEFSKDSNTNSGKLSGTFRDAKMQESYYEIDYKKDVGNNYQFILVGSSGQPNVILTKVNYEVTTDSFLEDVGKTLFKN